MKVCTCEQMRKIDADTMNRGAIPGIVLMENAALACVRELEQTGIVGKRVAVFCGKGNNGGDGLAIARHLHNRGALVTVYLLFGSDYHGDAEINYEITSRMGIKIVDSGFEENARLYADSADIIVDAIFGTGVRGRISGAAELVINAVNSSRAYTLSVDIPSGVNGDTGEICGVCIHADKTVTFGAYKRGLVLFPGCAYAGEIITDGISIPQNIIDAQGIKVNIADEQTASAIMPKRCENSHKGDYGKVLVIGGSTGMTGAPAMAAQAALVSGAGLVTAAVPASLNAIMEVKLTEAMTVPLKDIGGNISLTCTETAEKYIKKADAVLFGPGIGRGEDVRLILEDILKKCTVPLIIDADGITALAADVSVLKDAECPVILTPHSAEMSRLCKKSIDEIENDRIGVSAEFAKEYGVTLILKGHHTVVTASDGTQYINITGNSGMATGGSGDVLGGMTAAFAARGLSALDAAVLAVYLHGSAGDIARAKLGADSVTACGIIENISEAIQALYNPYITYGKHTDNMI